jgi:recombination protein RecT
MEDAAEMEAQMKAVAEGAKARLLYDMGEAAVLKFGDGECLRRKLTKRKGYTVADTSTWTRDSSTSRRKPANERRHRKRRSRTPRSAPKDFPAMLTAWLPEIQRALPRHISAERMARIALTAFRRNPKLGQCDPKSVFAAVIQSSQLGLEIDTLGRSYLIPYDRNVKTGEGWKKVTECQFVPGWKGLVDLMNRSGQGTVWTGAVYEGDEFEWQLGDNPFCKHKPTGESSERLTHTYAIGRVKGSDWPIIEVWPIEKVWKHRDRYNKVGDKHYSHDNPEMYARKVPLLQVLKYMPCSAELATAMALDTAAETTGQGLAIKDAIEGTWAPAEVAEEPKSGQGRRPAPRRSRKRCATPGHRGSDDHRRAAAHRRARGRDHPRGGAGLHREGEDRGSGRPRARHGPGQAFEGGMGQATNERNARVKALGGGQ